MEKVQRKIRKAIALLHRHEPEVQMSTTPTKILYVANGGVVCGHTYETLQSVCVNCSILKDFDIYLYFNKPYSFITFNSPKEAARVVDEWQGKVVSNLLNKIPLYFIYTNQLPQRWLSERGNTVPPDGLVLQEEFVSTLEEQELANLFDWERNGTPMNKRTVFHFGYNFLYTTNEPDISRPCKNPVPPLCKDLTDRMLSSGLISEVPNQVTVNVYHPGNGIPFHTDSCNFIGKEICSLSLISPVVMNFVEDKSSREYSLLLPRRSLLVMSGAARYKWRHGISLRKYDILPCGKVVNRACRISFTFRRVRRENIEQNSVLSDSKVQDDNLEKTFVHDVYNSIAQSFDASRCFLWPGVKKFIDHLPTGATLLDVGCGNGKYLSYREDVLKIGCDRSIELLKICRQKEYNVFQADCCQLPVADESFNAAVSIAVLHHLSNQERRINAVKEMLRILKRRGRALVYVWAFEQRRDNVDSRYLKSGQKKNVIACGEDDANENLPYRVHKSRQPFEAPDVLVPWSLRKNTEKGSRLLRYYHVFSEGELQALCEPVEGCCLIDSFYEDGNWCVVLEKD